MESTEKILHQFFKTSDLNFSPAWYVIKMSYPGTYVLQYALFRLGGGDISWKTPKKGYKIAISEKMVEDIIKIFLDSCEEFYSTTFDIFGLPWRCSQHTSRGVKFLIFSKWCHFLDIFIKKIVNFCMNHVDFSKYIN